MNSTLPFVEPQAKPLGLPYRGRMFYTASAVSLLLLMSIRVQQFYPGTALGIIVVGTLVSWLLTRLWHRRHATGFTRIVVDCVLSVLGAAAWLLLIYFAFLQKRESGLGFDFAQDKASEHDS
jgi:hypothetical protein